VHTSWDIGIGDSTSIFFFQALKNGTYNFINYYENNGEGLGHYIKYLNDFKFANEIEYGTHFVPHDMQNKEFTSGVDRMQSAREFGYEMTVVPRKGIDEGIQAVRSILPLCSFDIKKCANGIKCLDFYRKKWNESLKVYYDEPLHDRYSHGADSFRYAATGIKSIGFDRDSRPDDEIKAINAYWGM
jgi:phage terminase large subunit